MTTCSVYYILHIPRMNSKLTTYTDVKKSVSERQREREMKYNFEQLCKRCLVGELAKIRVSYTDPIRPLK